MEASWAGEIGVLVAAAVSSVFGWVSARKAERNTRPNGQGTLVEIAERNHDLVTQILAKIIELDDRVDHIEEELRKST